MLEKLGKENNMKFFKKEYYDKPDNSLSIFIVGGSFDENGGRESALVNQIFINMYQIAQDYYNYNWDISIRFINGGYVDELKNLLEETKNYDVVFWWANVPNDFEKIRNVKEVNPRTILVSSKRNDNEKYSFQELIQRALELKANLTVEFSKDESFTFNSHLSPSILTRFKMRVFDPLGVVWYEGFDVHKMTKALLSRLTFLSKVTRQGTTHIQKNIEVPDNKEFFRYVRECAEIFHEKINPAKDVKRFLGNSSFRCQRGFPSFKSDGYIFVSRRNVDKRFIDKDNFVPVKFEDNTVYYYGSHKPSVDTPIQVRLYELLPNVNYMIHSHCYSKNGKFTYCPIPCGGLEEVNEIKQVIKDYYDGDFNRDFYEINLVGHGCIIMSSNVEKMKEVEFVERQLPECFKCIGEEMSINANLK